eukprot:TRINITY_DN7850_c1_g1_i1.p1 TRINITY_DN7850_c1_g1~~TRINITY_DN7850_c1_g1_i1.p1  ORF type:complete len:685 (-),score=139.80 TRINITY_DN7850_c1_g1_i1:85-2139(-)
MWYIGDEEEDITSLKEIEKLDKKEKEYTDLKSAKIQHEEEATMGDNSNSSLSVSDPGSFNNETTNIDTISLRISDPSPPNNSNSNNNNKANESWSGLKVSGEGKGVSKVNGGNNNVVGSVNIQINDNAPNERLTGYPSTPKKIDASTSTRGEKVNSNISITIPTTPTISIVTQTPPIASPPLNFSIINDYSPRVTSPIMQASPSDISISILNSPPHTVQTKNTPSPINIPQSQAINIVPVTNNTSNIASTAHTQQSAFRSVSPQTSTTSITTTTSTKTTPTQLSNPPVLQGSSFPGYGGISIVPHVTDSTFTPIQTELLPSPSPLSQTPTEEKTKTLGSLPLSRSNSNSNSSITPPRGSAISVPSSPLIPSTSQHSIFTQFLQTHTCYDVIPASGKIVVLDMRLAVKSAFHALEENGIKSAPLWDEDTQDYCGMITVSDFIDILRHFYKDPHSNIFQELGHHKIKTWREIWMGLNGGATPLSLISTEPESTLLEASTILLKHQIHRLPIVDKKDTKSILHVITHSRILAFMMKHLVDLPVGLLNSTIYSLGIGTYDHVVTVLADTPLIVVLDFLAQRKISALPIVDEHGVVIDVYSKSDVPFMAKLGALSHADLDRPVQQVLASYGNRRPEQTYTCFKSDTLKDILDRCITKRVHRLICVDGTRRVEGIVSLSDILKYLTGDYL